MGRVLPQTGADFGARFRSEGCDSSTAGLDSPGGEGGLPRDGLGHAGDRVSVALDVFEIGGLADEVEGAEGFPDVVGIGGKIGEWRSEERRVGKEGRSR